MAGNDSENEEATLQIPNWAEASLEDVRVTNINAPVKDLSSAHDHKYQRAYIEAAQNLENAQAPLEFAQHKVYLMLGAAMGMHLRANNSRQPFGAQLILADGQRSAIPEDFRGSPQEALADAATSATHPVVRARLSDVSWLLDRKRSHLGRAAILAYLEIVKKLESSEFDSLLKEPRGALCPEGMESIQRALSISRAIGWETDEALKARDLLLELEGKAIATGRSVPIHWFHELDLRFGVSDPANIGGHLEAAIAAGGKEFEPLELWRLAAKAYHAADDKESCHRCLIAASDCLVSQSENALTQQGSAMLGGHFLSMAIAELHGVSGVKQRISELRHKLIDIQAGIPDEMGSFSTPLDLRPIIEQVENAIGGLGLRDIFFFFANMEKSPDPEQLIAEAKRTIQEHPLSSLFGSSHHDHEGKVIYRTDGEKVDGESSAVRSQIAQAEGIRRKIHAHGQVDVVRRNINAQFYLSHYVFQALLERSPFVPPDCLETYSKGFSRFFEGDFTSAVYILTPMLENSLRHVLRLHGHDVTKFDINDQTQQDRTISSLFEQMRSELDTVFGAAITTDIDNVFLSQPGPCLRHAVAHGLLRDGEANGADALYACWLIFRLCCIPIFKHRESIVLPS